MIPTTKTNINADKLFRTPKLCDPVVVSEEEVVEFELPFIYLSLNISPDTSEETYNLPLPSKANPTGLIPLSQGAPLYRTGEEGVHVPHTSVGTVIRASFDCGGVQ